MSKKRLTILFVLLVLCKHQLQAQKTSFFSKLEKDFIHPPQSARPWVFWYWMQAAVSKEGITADLEAMKQAGIGGAYLMPIKDSVSSPEFKPAIRQLSPEWFSMVKFAMQEAKRLQIEIGMHASDGFALAGGPWITPELSMQKIVFSKTIIQGGQPYNGALAQPAVNEGYYKDVAVYAYPASAIKLTKVPAPMVSTSTGVKADFLLLTNSKESFRADSVAWVQYSYPQPITCRTIVVRTNGNNYQSHRLWIQASNDGIHFRNIQRLEPPRHGWQDTDADVTHAITPTTAQYFRFVYDKQGTEAGSEDLDNAKWKPTLKVSGIQVLAEPTINQYESKNGEVWRVSKWTSTDQIPDSVCVQQTDLINLTGNYANGVLHANLPKGDWVILRMGHTSTGHKNETAGAAKGLECDKFNPIAINLQFTEWFGRIYKELGPELAGEVLKVFHLDSWECGSQNWSENFAAEFSRRRGYDLLAWLPVMAGVPLVSAQKSEQVLYDIRKTIAELVNDVFYETLSRLAHSKGCRFSAESIAPTMLSDGMEQYSRADLPMGEFWLNSPTHDKPNDMMDAVSGAHIYGKNIIQSESFTELRMAWDEHPGMLKTIGDRNFALGINRMVFHVFAHNPWLNRQPGYTLDGVGLYFQRNQTWFAQGKAWVDYIARCQALLQTGKPVADIAVYTGDELPRRSILPNRFVQTLPGIFGEEKMAAEKIRLANTGQPLRSIPDGVSHSANMADPENWVNPLNGYAYDSFNPDALWNLAKVENGQIVLPGGASYKILVLPASHPMNPGNLLTKKTVEKIIQLIKNGATILMDTPYLKIAGFSELRFTNKVYNDRNMQVATLGKGKAVLTPYQLPDFSKFQLSRDFEVNSTDTHFSDIAYTHRKSADADIYFIANQKNKEANLVLSFRVSGKKPELWNAVTGTIDTSCSYTISKGRTNIRLHLDENASVFVVFRPATKNASVLAVKASRPIQKNISFTENWKLQFNPAMGGPAEQIILQELTDWSKNENPKIKYYSGTAVYRNQFMAGNEKNTLLNLSGIHDIATVTINGVDCGTLWTAPFQLNISKAIHVGNNTIEIAVTNTWRNRLIGDHALPEAQRISFTTAPYRLDGKPLLNAGITGKVWITADE